MGHKEPREAGWGDVEDSRCQTVGFSPNVYHPGAMGLWVAHVLILSPFLPLLPSLPLPPSLPLSPFLSPPPQIFHRLEKLRNLLTQREGDETNETEESD